MNSAQEQWGTRRFQAVLDLLSPRYQEFVYVDNDSLANNASEPDDIAVLEDITFRELYGAAHPDFPALDHTS
jgi:hypothetical protein